MFNFLKSITVTVTICCCLQPVLAQDTAHYRGMTVNLDEVTVAAKRIGFDVNSFIRRVEEDTTFYRAFKNLHIVGFTGDNDIRIFDKKGNVQASLKSTTTQTMNGRCRTMNINDEKVTGDFYDRKGNYNYYTAELYGNLFFTKGTVCVDENGESPDHSSGSLARHKAQLKQLIFNPGKPVRGVPIVGNKVAIFSYDMQRYYNFSIKSEDYVTGVPCYVFTAKAKPGLNRLDKGEIVIDELITWFNKDNFEIVGRKYALSYKTMLFDFNVQMNVQMTKVNDLLIPALVTYAGSWDVPFKKRETAAFIAKFYNFSK
ncbi:outer membrane lipoprotein-sorting protein [Chitinophaga sp. Cy-1792]|uniref:outer membrane lipoprotein-sorting protein n=1 Tax=Chitinophaga sp. Cy-1792 TaxID=2608339 RepID=UPI00141E7CC6|nr:outer membrane lipoprotein-sorting protein [Chitinophaga sp. Cy-1792]NIG57248.1 outer membrane lipoprotein-sorting protein [Chitinophaga sp. Cy-1792]